MKRGLLEEIRVGTRTIDATEWPVRDQLWRTGPGSWQIVRELCNGVPRAVEEYASEVEAREAFERRLGGRKPNEAAAAGERVTVRMSAELRAELRAAIAARGGTVAEGPWILDAIREKLARDAERGR